MKKLLTPDEETFIEEKIAEVEMKTSAELKVIIVNYSWGSVIEKAQKLFEKHDLHQTEQRNAVMIMLVVKNRELLIYGDKGINEAVGDDFWVDTKNKMISSFKVGHMKEGFADGIEDIGAKLKEFFPYQSDDVNEISNEIIYEK